MKFSELLGNIPYRLAPNSADPTEFEVSGVCRDADRATKESVYVCVNSALCNAYLSAPRAYARGCRVFLSARELSLPRDAAVLLFDDLDAAAANIAVRAGEKTTRALTVIGVCGALGKTSVMLSFLDMARRAGRAAAAICREGVWRDGTLTRGKERALDAFSLQDFFADCTASGVEIAVVEISAYMLLKKSVFFIPFAALLCTGTQFEREAGGIAESPAECLDALFDFLQETASPCLILPAEMRESAAYPTPVKAAARVFSVGESEDDFAVLSCREIEDRSAGAGRFTLKTPETVFENLLLPSLSPHAAENALFAIALAQFIGVGRQEICASLNENPPYGTMEVLSRAGDRLIVCDSAYTPRMLKSALAALRVRTPEKLTVLFGSVGGRAKARRKELARAAETHADFTYLTADDPDGEPIEAILSEVESAFSDPSRCVLIPDRAVAIARAVSEMRAGDTLLLVGKSRDTAQKIHGVFTPFSERDAVRAALDNFYILL